MVWGNQYIILSPFATCTLSSWRDFWRLSLRENFNPIWLIELIDILDVVSSHPKPDQFSAKSVPRINIHTIYNDTILKTDLDSKGKEHPGTDPGDGVCWVGWLGTVYLFPRGWVGCFLFAMPRGLPIPSWRSSRARQPPAVTKKPIHETKITIRFGGKKIAEVQAAFNKFRQKLPSPHTQSETRFWQKDRTSIWNILWFTLSLDSPQTDWF